MAASSPGHIELERSLDSIVVGNRHRADLGDLDALTASIARDGLLQPITLTPDGVLVCGWRRLHALRRLGHRTTNVWIRSGLTDRLSRLLAEQNDNALHKPLTLVEAEALYRELKTVMAEDAARRQAATRFGGEPGAANLAAPGGGAGDARAQAARLLTGRASYTTLERLGRLRDLADDRAQPEHIRTQALEEVERIEAGGKVHGAHLRMNTALSLNALDQVAEDAEQPDLLRAQAATSAAEVRANRDARPVDLERLATDAVARIKATTVDTRPSAAPLTVPTREPVIVLLPTRAFVALWADLAGWTAKYDARQVATELTSTEWERVEAALTETCAFLAAVRDARAVERQAPVTALAG